MPDLSVSVVMATYNGEKYIEEQLNSILPQLGPTDELLISDDGSTDSTVEIAKRACAEKAYQTRFLAGPRKGVCENFAHAFKAARGDIVLICDQDDVWLSGKTARIKECFAKNEEIDVVLHDALMWVSDSIQEPPRLFECRRVKNGYLRNLVMSGYYGCCMGVRRSFLINHIDGVATSEYYDQYISLIAEKEKRAFLLPEVLIKHRLHGNNWSKPLRRIDQIQKRLRLLQATLAIRETVLRRSDSK